MNSRIAAVVRAVGFATLATTVLALGLQLGCSDSLNAQASASRAKASALANGAVGKWLLHYDYQPRSLHGKPAPVEVIEILLTLRANRDSVTGEWQRVLAPGEEPLRPYVVQGLQRGDSIFLQLVPLPEPDEGIVSNALHDIAVFMRTYVHGMPPTTTAVAAAIKGDVLTGTRTKVLLDGTPNGKAEPLSGTRTKP